MASVWGSSWASGSWRETTTAATNVWATDVWAADVWASGAWSDAVAKLGPVWATIGVTPVVDTRTTTPIRHVGGYAIGKRGMEEFWLDRAKLDDEDFLEIIQAICKRGILSG